MAENQKTSRKRQRGHTSSLTYAVQCGECFKWRVIPTQEEFEGIRSRILEDPFFCNKRANVSCEDPAEIEYDATRIWALDKPNLPKTPAGFQRELMLRRDFSRMDAFYVTPAGKKVRAQSGIASLVETNPEYKGLSTSDFSFVPPTLMHDTIPGNVARKGSSGGNKRTKTSREGVGDA